MGTELFEQMDFVENPQFEKIIEDILQQHYSVVPHFFSSTETGQLRELLLKSYEDDQFKKAAIGNHYNENIARDIRGDFIYWISETENSVLKQVFFERINTLVNYLNKTCFLGILQKEFHYAVYPEGTFYKRHLDAFQQDDRRKLSVVCYLNPDDWQPEDGGELVIFLPEGKTEREEVIVPWPGQIVIFESQVLEHEVRLANRPRMSITGWLKTR